MAANTSPIFPATPFINTATLGVPAAVTARGVQVNTNGLTVLSSASTNGRRIDNITVKGGGSTAASNVFIWIVNPISGAFLFDEIDVPAVTAGNTTDSAIVSKQYTNLVLPANFTLYVSQTVLTPVQVFAFGGDY